MARFEPTQTVPQKWTPKTGHGDKWDLFLVFRQPTGSGRVEIHRIRGALLERAVVPAFMVELKISVEFSPERC